MTQNLNLLQNKDFKFVINRLPMVEYFCTTVNIPGISGIPAEFPTPFTTIKVTPDHLQFSPLQITFKVDEDLRNYEEILNWMFSYAFPNTYDEYKNSNVDKKALYQSKLSDLSVFTSTNKYNPNVEFVFKDAFPTDLGDLTFEISTSDVPVMTCTASFSYTNFYINRNT